MSTITDPQADTETFILRMIREKLFCPETRLIYDYITDRDDARRFRHLPGPAEIARQFPNPCGWGTGMEDCMLHAGAVLDVLRLRRRHAGEENREAAETVLDGIYRCATVHDRPGFIARGLSPRDGRSCYANSSRDQFTLAVYGVWRFLDGYPDAAETSRERARFVLRSVAEFCRRRITPENGYCLGRLDGGRAAVSRLWDCAPHEMLRLPMFYGAAYLATGLDKYRRWMEEYVAPGLAATLRMEPDAHWWDISIVQMMLSLRFFEETGLCPALADGLARARRSGAELARRDLRRTLSAAEAFRGPWETVNVNWRLLPMVIHPSTLSENDCESTFGDASYPNPRFPPAFEKPNALLRALGNDLVALFHAGEAPSADERRRLAAVTRRVDFPRCGGAGVVPLLHAMNVAREAGVELCGGAMRTARHGGARAGSTTSEGNG